MPMARKAPGPRDPDHAVDSSHIVSLTFSQQGILGWPSTRSMLPFAPLLSLSLSLLPTPSLPALPQPLSSKVAGQPYSKSITSFFLVSRFCGKKKPNRRKLDRRRPRPIIIKRVPSDPLSIGSTSKRSFRARCMSLRAVKSQRRGPRLHCLHSLPRPLSGFFLSTPLRPAQPRAARAPMYWLVSVAPRQGLQAHGACT